MKKETLEEAFSNYVNERYHFPIQDSNVDLESAKFGAKWQQERSYSEEDLISFAHFYFQEEFNSTMQTSKSTAETFKEWFEQNKKK